ncbi:MAG: 30S ribosome-binding factor RbfA [Puniceicoccales bacterium]|jgi:ribosome-binding factor A|nr:30S ribosome-binding factor RbfA [Puniceicoccales bacterium]
MTMTGKGVRLASVLQRELSKLLRKNFRSESTMITITHVFIGDDMAHARVFFSTPDEHSAAAGLIFLQKKKNEFKRLLSKEIAICKFPELHFHFDAGQEKELRVCGILDSLK